MSQNNDMNLSLSGEAFAALRSDFNEVLHSTMRGMIDTEQDVAEINMKVKIILTESSAPDFTVAGGHQTREITKPKFEHSITAVIQRKEKKTGSFAGEYELVFDADTGTYVVRPIENGQTTLFDGDGPAVSAPMRFCSFSPNRICRKMAGNGVQPLHNYTCRFRPSSLKQADKSGLDGLQTGKSDSG